MKALDEAIALWESACSSYEDALGAEETDGEALEGLRQDLFEAGVVVDAVVAGLTEGLGLGTAKLLTSLQAGIAGKVRIQEHRALESERAARHGELAGAGFTEREAIGQLEYAAETLRGVAASLREAAEILEGL